MKKEKRTVRVARGDGTPVAGAVVRRFGAPPARAVTDEEGKCLLPQVDGGSSGYHVEVGGMVHVSPAGDVLHLYDVLPVTLFEAARVRGRVRAEGTRNPVSGVVVAYDNGCPVCGQRSAITAADGTFELDDVPFDTSIALTVDKAGFARISHACRFRVPAALGSSSIELVLRPGTTVRGEVRELGSGAPVEGVIVHSTRAEDFETLRTDEQGRFEGRFFVDEVEGLDLRWRKKGYCPMTVSLTAEAFPLEAPIRLQVFRSCPVEGRVRDRDGQPVEGASVRLERTFADIEAIMKHRRGRSPGSPLRELPASWSFEDEGDVRARTDARGRFKSDDGILPWNDAYSAGVYVDGVAVHSERIEPCTEPGEIVQLDLSIAERELRGTIFGRLTVNGLPAKGFVSGPGRADTDDNGDFRMEVAVGETTLSAVPDVLSSLTGHRFPELEAVVHVEGDREIRCDFNVDCPMTGIGGRVTSVDNTPVVGVDVDVSGAVGRVRARTDQDGTYEARLPEIGAPFQVQVGVGAGARFERNVSGNRMDVDIVLHELGRVLLRVIDGRTGENVHGFDLEWRHAEELQHQACGIFRRPDAYGRWAIELQSGLIDLVVHAEHRGYEPSLRRISVAPNEEANLVVEMVLGWSATLRLEDGCPQLPDGVCLVLVEREFWLPEDGPRALFERNSSLRGRVVDFGPDGLGNVRGLGRGTYSIAETSGRIQIFPILIELEERPTEPIQFRWTWDLGFA
jgi:hypothetical protein